MDLLLELLLGLCALFDKFLIVPYVSHCMIESKVFIPKRANIFS